MDFISHGLWAGITSGRKNKRDFWKSFAWGAMPDIIPFSPMFIIGFYNMVFGSSSSFFGRPDIATIPSYVFDLYSVTHSYFTFLFVFLIFYLIYKKPNWLMIGWPIHITMDIFTHSKAFFPTPFLWPFSSYRFDGVPWSNWFILIPDVLILAILYLYFFVIKPKFAFKNKQTNL